MSFLTSRPQKTIQSAVTRLAISCAAAVALAAPPRTSRADSVTAEAMTLFNEGVRLRDAGRPNEACALFAESNRLEPTAGKLLNVANCHEREGKWATAWAEFLSASHLYKIRSDDDAVAECQRRAALLEPRLSRLTLRVERPIATLVVKRNGRAVSTSQFGLPLPIDPGDYTITAEAPGHAPFRASARINSAKGDVTITVPALATQPVATPATERPVAGYVVAGLGVAALGVGATFGALALSSNARVQKACPSIFECSQDDAIAARDRANAQAWAANVSIGLGVAGLATGGYLLFFASRSHKTGTKASRRGSVAIAPASGGLKVRYNF